MVHARAISSVGSPPQQVPWMPSTAVDHPIALTLAVRRQIINPNIPSLPKFVRPNWCLSQAKVIPSTVTVPLRHQSTMASKDAASTGIVRWAKHRNEVNTVLSQFSTTLERYICCGLESDVRLPSKWKEKPTAANNHKKMFAHHNRPIWYQWNWPATIERAIHMREQALPRSVIWDSPNWKISILSIVLSREFGLSLHWPRQWLHLLPCAVAEQPAFFNHLEKHQIKIFLWHKFLGYVKKSEKEGRNCF